MSTTPTPPSTTAPATGASDTTTYTHTQFTEAVERARTEERGRINVELENARKEANTLKDQITSQTTELTTLRNNVETFKKAAQANGNVDVAKLIEEVSDRVSKAATAASQSRMSELETNVTKLTQQLKTKELSEFRTKAIADAGGADVLIPELVRGNTEEEIRASVTESKSIFDRNKARFAPSTTLPPVVPATAGEPAKPGAFTAPVVAAPAATTLPPVLAPSPEQNPTGIRPMTNSGTRVNPRDWKGQREAAMRGLEGRYAAPGSA